MEFNSKITITKKLSEADAITHNGVFHADDVLAAVILAKVFNGITLYRASVVPENINSKTIIFDIGHGELDHHQLGGNGQRKNGVPFASSGLIWKKYGPKLLENLDNSRLVWGLVDRILIAGIDAKDNNSLPRIDYPTQGTLLNTVIFNFNPSWDSEKNPDEAFLEAAIFMEMAFNKILENAISTAKAENLVKKAIESTKGNIMILDQYLPWLNFIFTSDCPNARNIEFVVFPARRGYNFQCVPIPRSKDVKHPVPISWRGLDGDALKKITGVKTATFCHPEGFIGGAETQEDAIKLCKLASETKI